MTDDEVLEAIAKGRRSVPAFEAVLGPEVLTALVGYLRDLSTEGDS